MGSDPGVLILYNFGIFLANEASKENLKKNAMVTNTTIP